jgi:hypothetical protein
VIGLLALFVDRVYPFVRPGDPKPAQWKRILGMPSAAEEGLRDVQITGHNCTNGADRLMHFHSSLFTRANLSEVNNIGAHRDEMKTEHVKQKMHLPGRMK